MHRHTMKTVKRGVSICVGTKASPPDSNIESVVILLIQRAMRSGVVN